MSVEIECEEKSDSEVNDIVKKEVLHSDTDEAWKYILGVYLKEFVKLFWPEAYRDIDWNRGYEFLEQEMLPINRPQRKEKRVIDKLVKVWRKNGDEKWILLHVEVQGEKEDDFEERMFIYRYRIFDRHGMKIATLVVLVDSDKKWRPTVYKDELWGSYVMMGFPIVKLLDFKGQEKALLDTGNPFAVIVNAQLKAIAARRRNEDQRLASKISVIKSLYKEGYNRDEIIHIGYFLDGIFALSKEKKLIYNETVRELEKELKMSYLNSFEEAGLDKGVQLGESIILSRLLELRFQSIPQNYRDKIQQSHSDLLIKWAERILFCTTLEQIFED